MVIKFFFPLDEQYFEYSLGLEALSCIDVIMLEVRNCGCKAAAEFEGKGDSANKWL